MPRKSFRFVGESSGSCHVARALLSGALVGLYESLNSSLILAVSHATDRTQEGLLTKLCHLLAVVAWLSCSDSRAEPGVQCTK